MSDDAHVTELLYRWSRAREQGQTLVTAELCADRPDLIPELERRIAALHPTLGDVALPAGSDVPLTEGPTAPERSVPGFDVLQELGRGGMGVVYQARQHRLNRIVALKMVLAGSHAGPESLIRFMDEAEAIASLSHPGIVQVYEVGTHEGLPYFAMEHCPGESLADRLDGTPLPAREAATLTEQLARAVHYAHSHGIVHRDLKPANVLQGEDGSPKITDFGLAKRLEGESGLTQTGAVIGTPSYMAPEQARGDNRRIGPPADVYALGAILYECLTGRPPFKAATTLETLGQVMADDPIPPTRLQPGTPRDLETIGLKCLQKDPTRRYSSAEALAEDLRRFLEGEPVQARPVGRTERLIKWARRRPALATLTGVSLAAAFALFGVVSWSSLQLQKERDVAVRARAEEADQRRTAERERDNADQARRDAEAQRRAALAAKNAADQARRAAETTLVDLYTTSGLMASEQNDPARAILWFVNAAGLARNETEREQANRVRVRTWMRQIPVPVRALPHPGQSLHSLTFHPGGKHLLTTAKGGRCTLWDLDGERALPLPGGERAVTGAAFSPDGRWLALGAGGRVDLYSFPEGKSLHALSFHEGIDSRKPLSALAFSPDGRYLALAGDTVRVWDCHTHTFTGPALEQPGEILTLSFNRAGDRLATGDLARSARIYRFPPREEDKAPLLGPIPHWQGGARTSGQLIPVTFLAGDRAVTVTGESAVTLWDLGKPKARQAIPFEIPGANQVIDAVVANADGSRFAVSGFAGARVYSARTGEVLGAAMKHRNNVHGLAFHPAPESDLLLTVSWDRVARMWSLPAGTAIGSPINHHAPLESVVFSPDGHLFATAQVDGLVRVWRSPAPSLWQRRVRLEGAPTRLRLTPDSKHVFPTGAGFWGTTLRKVRFFEVASGRAVGPVLNVGEMLMDVAVSPDGQTAVTLSSRSGDKQTWRDGRLQFWDRRTGSKLYTPLPLPSAMGQVAFHPAGTSVIAFLRGGVILRIDPGTGEVQAVKTQPGATSRSTRLGLRFTEDGKSFLTWGQSQGVCVWDAGKLVPRYPLLDDDGPSYSARSSPDGRFLVTGDFEGNARIWEHATGKPVGKALSHPDWVFEGLFSPDGQTLLTICRDGMARAWDWRSGTLSCPPFRHEDEVYGAAFTPDGRAVWTCSRDHTARLWEAHTGKPLTPPLDLAGRWGFTALITADGTHAVVSGYASRIHILDLQEILRAEALDVDDLRRLGEILAVQQIHEGGGVVNLTTEEWLARWRLFRARYPRFAALDPWAPAVEWHRQQFQKYLGEGKRQGALFHLNRLLEHAPGDWQAYRERGLLRQALGQDEQAMADWERAVKAGADGGKLWLEVARRLRDPDQAVEALNRAARVEKAGWQVFYERGRYRARQGRWDDVAADFTEAQERGANPTEIWYQLYRQVREGERKLWCLEQGARQAPKDPLALSRLANVRAARGLFEQAEDTFEQFRQLRPGHSFGWYNVALMQLARGDRAGYRRTCGEMVKQFWGQPAPPPTRVLQTLFLGPEAVDDFTAPLREARGRATRSPSSWTAWQRLGALQYRAGREGDAVATLKAAGKLSPTGGSPQDFLFLAMAEFSRGNKEGAQQWYERAAKEIDRRYPALPAGVGLTAGWSTRLELDLLGREAKELLQGKGP